MYNYIQSHKHYTCHSSYLPPSVFAVLPLALQGGYYTAICPPMCIGYVRSINRGFWTCLVSSSLSLLIFSASNQPYLCSAVYTVSYRFLFSETSV